MKKRNIGKEILEGVKEMAKTTRRTECGSEIQAGDGLSGFKDVTTSFKSLVRSLSDEDLLQLENIVHVELMERDDSFAEYLQDSTIEQGSSWFSDDESEYD